MNEQPNQHPDEHTDERAATSPAAPVESPNLTLEAPDTQPVTASPTITYPRLPDKYALADHRPDAGTPDAGAPAAVPAVTSAVAARTADASGRIGVRRSPRVRTVVFGLVMLTISVMSLLALLTDVRVDGGVVGLGLLIGAGAALVAGGVAAAVREARGGPGAVR